MITKIVLREPRYRDLMDLGVPSTWVAVPGGGGFEQESFTALEEWVNRLVVEMDVNFLELLSLKDALALRAAVRDFFFAAAGATESKPSTDLSEVRAWREGMEWTAKGAFALKHFVAIASG